MRDPTLSEEQFPTPEMEEKARTAATALLVRVNQKAAEIATLEDPKGILLEGVATIMLGALAFGIAFMYEIMSDG